SEVNEAVRKYTYEDYLNRDDDVRFELIDGVIYLMANPGRAHQEIVGELYFQLAGFLRGKQCKVYLAPFGVKLSVGEGADTILEPDLFVVCDRSKLDDSGHNGGPDMVIEVLSPSTSKKDRTIKFDKYLQSGVRELWFVDPVDKTVIVHILKNGEYFSKAYDDKGTVSVHVLDGCTIVLPEVFADV
ncbi:MAG: Uma2 family endonuclease, partial [Oscillospiraceae bacterium]|nr:Uma2 family endonuclease [Oscillospiraceae bacterium]